MKPSLFHGGVDPLKAAAWVLGIEKLFEVFPCTEAQKVLLTAFTLEDDARRWWMKVSKFEGLKQGNRTVAEYESQFTELARFVPYMVDTDYKKARKFEGGLRNSIQEKVNVLKLTKWVDVLDRALMSEAKMNQNSEWKGKKQDSDVNKESSRNKKSKSKTLSQDELAQRNNSASTCLECGKKHREICYRISGACYRCDRKGHTVRNCPHMG
ncbi:uncharacterized protein LOC114297826 [Camellia sinensis]|uniref:uncharacterized protein LOC114297826 n=1 Tax=Camellia sinensis TaxID=4442 RepID=UPI001036572C|nr:uncharacterized protein LOC114297826 [Camellia sinensis]